MKKNTLAVIFLISFFFIAIPLSGQVLSNSPQEKAFLENPAAYSYFDAAFIMSGIGLDFMSNYRTDADTFLGKLKNAYVADDWRRSAESLYSFTHKILLKKYVDTAFSMDTVFKTGRYNLYSGALVYQAVLEKYGIPFQTLVLSGAVVLEVGLTNPVYVLPGFENGFDMESNAQAQEVFHRVTGVTFYPKLLNFERPDKKAWFGYIYAGLGRNYLKSDKSAWAWESALKAHTLSPQGREVRETLVLSAIGYARSSAVSADPLPGFDALATVRKLYPAEDRVGPEAAVICKREVSRYAEAGNIAGATAIYNAYTASFGKNYEIAEHYYTLSFYTLTEKKGDLAGALALAQKAAPEFFASQAIVNVMARAFDVTARSLSSDYRKYPEGEKIITAWYGLLKNDKWDNPLGVYYGTVAKGFADAGNMDKAVTVLKKGLEIAPDSLSIKAAAVSIIGGKAAALFTAKDFKGGIVLSRKALEFDPKSEAVRNNLKIVYREQVFNLIEARDYKAATALLNEALPLFPDDEKLKYYKDYIRKKTGGK